ncbi:LysE family translocator [Salaquimonas pukyongi]|uniref:LysE family translocator n=1 Tax=Salaquimonas pukyongi TaxID=2712698 RepID=UPI00096B7400|nr:LysE family translocator [Salaquimonas pukyongi]
MTLTSSFALFFIMCALAALPSSSVALVVARSAIYDVKNGLAAAAGIVAGDLIFMTMAILSMTALASQLGALFAIIKYLAAAYLIWFGIGLIRSQLGKQPSAPATQIEAGGKQASGSGTLAASFGAGLLLTLGDVKAIFFYASLLPTFLDLASLTAVDIAIISTITIVSVGLVKAVYAAAANRISAASKGFSREREAKLLTGGFFVCIGGYLAVKG